MVATHANGPVAKQRASGKSPSSSDIGGLAAGEVAPEAGLEITGSAGPAMETPSNTGINSKRNQCRWLCNMLCYEADLHPNSQATVKLRFDADQSESVHQLPGGNAAMLLASAQCHEERESEQSVQQVPGGNIAILVACAPHCAQSQIPCHVPGGCIALVIPCAPSGWGAVWKMGEMPGHDAATMLKCAPLGQQSVWSETSRQKPGGNNASMPVGAPQHGKSVQSSAESLAALPPPACSSQHHCKGR